jgi:putative OmpL-like beta-barrel porin-2/carboxypeptidase family protein
MAGFRRYSDARKWLGIFAWVALVPFSALAQGSGIGTEAPGFGALRGVTVGPTGVALAGVLVQVRGGDGSVDRESISANDGTFLITDLRPGEYRVTALKEGFSAEPQATVEIAQNQTANAKLALAAVPDPAVAALNPATSPELSGGFLHRFFQFYANDWKGSSSGGPDPKYRGYPPPVSAPPFPFAIWPYGGSVTIGYPFTQSGPLMNAIWSGKHGDWWKKTGIQFYGWLNAGFNESSSRQGGYSTYPEAYAERGNVPQLDQEVLYIERQPDTVQTDHIDWGFRISPLYGLDYRFTTGKGYWSNQLLGKNLENGFDVPMAYFDLYVPQIAQGMNIRVGRYISLPDIEAQLAPNNYTYSHSLLYTFDCYTQTGINTTTKLSNHWQVQVGVSAGCDVAPWVKTDRKLTLNACLSYTWRTGLDQVYGCDNTLNDGSYAYNNLTAYYFTWYHKFSASSHWHSDTESWYQYERHTPNVNNPVGFNLIETNANGAFCDHEYEVTCFAPEWAIVNYLVDQFGPRDYLTIRNEYFDDMKGQRTGFRTRYTEHLIGWGHWVGTTVLVRPELRFERAYDTPAYNNGTKKNQFTAACDVILFF